MGEECVSVHAGGVRLPLCPPLFDDVMDTFDFFVIAFISVGPLFTAAIMHVHTP